MRFARWLKEAWQRIRGRDHRSPIVRLLANTYLRGNGLEIGALFNPLPLPRGAKAKYVDRMSVEQLRLQYPNLAHLPLVPVDIIDDGERLATIADASQDFVIANEFLEHCQDPIGTLKHLFRVVKPHGIVYLAIPDKRFTFDRKRPVTSLEHLQADHRFGPHRSRREHFLEYARLVHDAADDAEAERLADELMRKDFSIHYHVWTQKEMLDLLTSLQNEIGFDFEAVSKHRHEVIFLLRKRPQEDAVGAMAA